MRRMRSTWSTRAAAVAVLFGLGLTLGCDPNIEQREAPIERVTPVFDPETSTLPLPNDIALQSDGRLPQLVPDDFPDSAEKEFAAWFASHTGWLADQAIEIPFSGALDESTLTDETVRLFRMTEGGLEPQDASLEYVAGEERSLVRVVPEAALVPGSRYAVIVTKDIEDPAGNTIVEPLPIFFAASPEPLVDAEGDATVSLLEGNPALPTLEGLRQMLAPIYAGAEEFGIGRDDVAMAFRWTVSPQVSTVLDPATATVPVPNTLALDPDGTFPRSALCTEPGGRNAQSYVDDYLATLNGWPTSVPITLPLSGPVDEDTITDETVQLWRLMDDGSLERVEVESLTLLTERIVQRWDGDAGECVTMTFDGFSILVTPAEELEIQAHYVAFATRELRSPQGLPVLPPAAIAMAVQPHPVLEDGKSTVSRITDEQAQSIAGVQAVLRPAVERIEAETDLTHTDFASVWTWFTWQDTFVVFDPATGQIPFPNAFVTENGRVNLPTDGADDLQLAILTELNQRMGFSVSANGWIPLQGKIDESTLDHGAVVLAQIPTLAPERMTADDYSLTYAESFDHLLFTPKRPLLTNVQHAGIVSTALHGANGRPVKPTPAFVFLRSEFPLVDGEGNSNVPGLLDDATAGALEVAREAYKQLFVGARLLGFEREDIATAWAFVTGDSTRELQEYRAMTINLVDARAERTARRFCDTQAEGCADDAFLIADVPATMPDPNNAELEIDMSNVGMIQNAGEFDTTMFLDPATLQMRAFDAVDTAPVGITVFVPRESEGGCQAPFDAVIVQHGLRNDRVTTGYALANEFAAFPSCLATVAVDAPLHGGRAAGSTNLHPGARPENSGEGFLSPNLLATKNLFEQTAIDLFVLRRIIEGDEGVSGLEALFGTDEASRLFTGRTGYAGISLGGVIGTLFLTVEPEVTTGVLNVGGGKLTEILQGSIGAPILGALEGMGIEPGTFTFMQTMALIQWVADYVDPFTFAPHLREDPLDVLAYDPSSGEFSVVGQTDPVDVLMQMAVGDGTIPNETTVLLANTIGVSLEDTTFDDVPHGFLSIRDTDNDAFVSGYCGRLQAASWLASGLDDAGEATLPEALTAEACLASPPGL